MTGPFLILKKDVLLHLILFYMIIDHCVQSKENACNRFWVLTLRWCEMWQYMYSTVKVNHGKKTWWQI